MINLNPEEKIVLEVRRHWLVFAIQNFFFVALAVLPLIFGETMVSMLFSWPGANQIEIPGSLPFVLYFLWLLVLWVAFAVSWTNYYLDVWHVTSEKIVDVDQLSLFTRREAITRLDRIQDISVATPGILATIFHYGTIQVQTAGERRKFAMAYVANPEQVRSKILELIHAQSVRPQKVEVISHSDERSEEELRD